MITSDEVNKKNIKKKVTMASIGREIKYPLYNKLEKLPKTK
ncbi:hypothetical protein PTZ02_16805 [Clostridium sp. 'White wine YQ']|nr:hypothetical protein [Clostridium sp. 'White wine YQ']